MKRFIGKCTIFSLPFIAALIIELMLPPDTFTFRVWEGISVQKPFGVLQGPFFPNVTMRKSEEGDLGHHTPGAVKKNVLWVTDRYGYRNIERDTERYPIVVLGDSNTVGGGLTQKDTISEILRPKMNVPVYPLAPASMKSFFRHRALSANLPDVVILSRIEREIIDLKMPKASDRKMQQKRFQFFINHVEQNRTLQQTAIVLNRVSKLNMLNYFKASISRAGSPGPRFIEIHGKPYFFLDHSLINRNVSDEKLKNTVQTIQRYNDTFRSLGIRFIFLPIPNKENIYHAYLGQKEPDFLGRLLTELRISGIEVIDTEGTFRAAFREKGVELYQPDDTHWNRNGVELAAGLIADHLTKGDRKSP